MLQPLLLEEELILLHIRLDLVQAVDHAIALLDPRLQVVELVVVADVQELDVVDGLQEVLAAPAEPGQQLDRLDGQGRVAQGDKVEQHHEEERQLPRRVGLVRAQCLPRQRGLAQVRDHNLHVLRLLDLELRNLLWLLVRVEVLGSGLRLVFDFDDPALGGRGQELPETREKLADVLVDRQGAALIDDPADVREPREVRRRSDAGVPRLQLVHLLENCHQMLDLVDVLHVWCHLLFQNFVPPEPLEVPEPDQLALHLAQRAHQRTHVVCEFNLRPRLVIALEGDHVLGELREGRELPRAHVAEAGQVIFLQREEGALVLEDGVVVVGARAVQVDLLDDGAPELLVGEGRLAQDAMQQ
mmetsp:Transcript_19279/g.57738  ORF Transcript_19279/g.57738 Transcript_19279/m.57738 type:complete len:357 (+) Transcript_19279:3439-4509(+)